MIVVKNKLNDYCNQKNYTQYEQMEKEEKIKRFGELLVKIVASINKNINLLQES